MPDTTQARNGLQRETLELPTRGLPVSEEAVTHWFTARHGRAPTDAEVGALLAAMADRDSQTPRVGPSAQPEGWATPPAAPPATRR